MIRRDYKSILCLNGELPSYEFFENFDLPIIAADGAANYLTEIGIEPSIIIGDMDSVNKNLLLIGKYIESKDQNYCDFEKSIDYIKKNNLEPTIIFGINGGCLDRILNNLNIFSKIDATLYCDDMFGFATSSNIEMTLPLNTKISIFGLPKCLISTRGLKWELDDSILSFPDFSSCCNRSIIPKISFKILSGKTLIFIYTVPIFDAGIFI
ncbi:thiamine pyrophosphokinase [Alphaproteobacteria bacterium]|nr:thiamine pyrophosphokinase [Alphaproteobacteria bacterium]